MRTKRIYVSGSQKEYHTSKQAVGLGMFFTRTFVVWYASLYVLNAMSNSDRAKLNPNTPGQNGILGNPGVNAIRNTVTALTPVLAA
jgi:hypothetical protein